MSGDRHKDLRKDIVAHGRSLFDRGLAPGSSGNLSIRLSDGTILITPTRSSLGRLDADAIAEIAPDGSHVGGDRPSKELFLHSAIYSSRPRAGAVVHLHATASAAVSCLARTDPQDCLPPLTPYFVMQIGRLPLIPYARPGAGELAGMIADLSRDHPALLLANHGPVVSGTSLSEAVDRIEELEQTAKLFLMLDGRETRLLDEADIAELRQAFGDPCSAGDEN